MQGLILNPAAAHRLPGDESTGNVTTSALASAPRLRNPGAASSKPPSTRCGSMGACSMPTC